jgi:hypothetical protein
MDKGRFAILITVLFLPIFAFTQPVEREKKAIQKVIIDGYIEGVFLKGDTTLIKANWHDACDIVYFEPKSKTLMKGSAVKHFAGHFKKKPGPFNENITYVFKDIQITGYAAVATVDIYNKDKSKQIYTDYLCLYKFEDGWKIVTKIFYAYPRE